MNVAAQRREGRRILEEAMRVSMTESAWGALRLQLEAQRCFGGPAACRDADEIEAICRRLGSDFVQALKPGTLVEIDEGLFHGLLGTVIGVGDKQHVVVAVRLMSGLGMAEIDPTRALMEDAFGAVAMLPTA
jgi:transcription antitermination factor NusG